jgi:hypothetical protein
VPLEEPPDRVLARAHLALQQQSLDLGKRQVRLLFYEIQKPIGMKIERRLSVTANPVGLSDPRAPPRLHPFDRCGGADGKYSRSSARREAFPNRLKHADPQILRISLGHSKVSESKHQETRLFKSKMESAFDSIHAKNALDSVYKRRVE